MIRGVVVQLIVVIKKSGREVIRGSGRRVFKGVGGWNEC